jgi:hypothetical protein
MQQYLPILTLWWQDEHPQPIITVSVGGGGGGTIYEFSSIIYGQANIGNLVNANTSVDAVITGKIILDSAYGLLTTFSASNHANSHNVAYVNLALAHSPNFNLTNTVYTNSNLVRGLSHEINLNNNVDNSNNIVGNLASSILANVQVEHVPNSILANNISLQTQNKIVRYVTNGVVRDPWAVYEFDSDGTDYLGNGPTLINASAIFSTGILGNAFCGSDGYKTQFGNANWPDSSNGFSFGWWAQLFYVDGFDGFDFTITSATKQFVFSDYGLSSTSRRFGVYLTPNTLYDYTHISGDWMHFAVTYNNSTEQLLVYMNGIEVINIICPPYAGPSRWEFKPRSPSYMDQVFIFEGIYTPDEINHIYNNGVGRIYDDYDIISVDEGNFVNLELSFVDTITSNLIVNNAFGSNIGMDSSLYFESIIGNNFGRNIGQNSEINLKNVISHHPNLESNLELNITQNSVVDNAANLALSHVLHVAYDIDVNNATGINAGFDASILLKNNIDNTASRNRGLNSTIELNSDTSTNQNLVLGIEPLITLEAIIANVINVGSNVEIEIGVGLSGKIYNRLNLELGYDANIGGNLHSNNSQNILFDYTGICTVSSTADNAYNLELSHPAQISLDSIAGLTDNVVMNATAEILLNTDTNLEYNLNFGFTASNYLNNISDINYGRQIGVTSIIWLDHLSAVSVNLNLGNNSQLSLNTDITNQGNVQTGLSAEIRLESELAAIFGLLVSHDILVTTECVLISDLDQILVSLFPDIWNTTLYINTLEGKTLYIQRVPTYILNADYNHIFNGNNNLIANFTLYINREQGFTLEK